MLLTLVISLVVGLVVGAVPPLAILRGGFALKAELRRSEPAPQPPPDPEELTPNELALLSGGPVRVGETAIMDAFLHGRIRQDSDGLLTLVGPSRHHVHEKDPVRRELVKTTRTESGTSAREILGRIITGRGMDQLRTNLASSGLIVDSPGLSQALSTREKALKVVRPLSTVLLLTVAVDVLLFFFVDPGPTPLVLIVGGLGALTTLSAARAATAVTGGASPRPNTPAGNAVVGAARERYGAHTPLPPPTGPRSADGMSLDHAIRRTAVTGFRSLRRAAPARRSAKDDHDRSVSIIHGGDTDSASETESDSVTLEVLCAFADLCQGLTSSGGDGWGGFGLSGDGGDSGGGFGGGSGDGGSGGGFGGGFGGGGGGDGGGGG
ncbi:TIGR04222 domain-containing membrane protein [Nocardiopsis halotolerans]|uniref:TIGR04222 domain-containing membrane protein n=1 Tax=Nocardiopsis halotolerans TaxID=124252 RepID=UPI001267DB0D|nr:TIGR04222 domain-containing membrane protein [Nocardiopsis halotolerans]